MKPITPKKVILVGDSTTQVNSGWGSSFCADGLARSVPELRQDILPQAGGCR